MPPRVIIRPGIDIPESVQPQLIIMSDNNKPGDLEAQLIHILQNNIQDDSPIYITVHKVPSTEVESNIVNIMSFGIIITIINGILIFLLSKIFNWYFR